MAHKLKDRDVTDWSDREKTLGQPYPDSSALVPTYNANNNGFMAHALQPTTPNHTLVLIIPPSIKVIIGCREHDLALADQALLTLH